MRGWLHCEVIEARERNAGQQAKKKPPQIRICRGLAAVVLTCFGFSESESVTPQGLEPQLTEPESVVLPITPWGSEALCGEFYQSTEVM